ncbi:phosphotransferase [Lentzea sp. NBRC 105346]|uniref:phosphotransferase family protein n=1 Tax=Lentzea sp. NBRC 105346 TaxID=3032205 RepID=UPI0024A10826|nr:aminoglycoside phosphotransferase family protein [Lentzea sp. NBRC 105346]GLZ32369.1 phosphotransferase [Lentzea sp. NBRC 105346]
MTVVDALRAHLGLKQEAERFEEGSLPVYAIGDDLVLKLFPPEDADESAVEAAALQAVQGKLAIPTPKLHDTGEFEGWGYVLMQRLHGTPVESATVSQCAQLGEALKDLHAITPPESLPAPDWPRFVEQQQRNATAQQRDLDPHWREQIDDFLNNTDLGNARTAFLHTEVMNAHLVEQDGKLTGLFDFEPAMRGATEYEFVATGIFVTKGDQEKQRALTKAYGEAPDPRKVMAYTLLHVYSNLAWYLKELPGQERTLDRLAQRWFGLD